jgi:hypothetical protein
VISKGKLKAYYIAGMAYGSSNGIQIAAAKQNQY